MDSNLNGLYLVEHIFTLKMSCQAWERHVCVKKKKWLLDSQIESSKVLKITWNHPEKEISWNINTPIQNAAASASSDKMFNVYTSGSLNWSSRPEGWAQTLTEAPQSHSSSHYPKVMTMGEGRTINQLVNREIHLQALLILHQWTPVHHQHNIITLQPTGCQSSHSTLYSQFNNSPRLKVNRSSC